MPLELGRKIPYDIHIRPSDNMGFIVKIGCGEFVAETVEDLIARLDRYLDDPKAWEKKFNARPGRGNICEEITREEPPTAGEGDSHHWVEDEDTEEPPTAGEGSALADAGPS